MKYILPLLLLTACGHRFQFQVDAELSPYIDQFYSEAKARGIFVEHGDLTVNFGDLKPNQAGLCETQADVTPKVTISRIDFEAADEVDKLALIFHELGHCLLNRKHNNNMTQMINPITKFPYKRSIMNEEMGFDFAFFMQHETEYIDELFLIGSGPNENH